MILLLASLLTFFTSTVTLRPNHGYRFSFYNTSNRPAIIQVTGDGTADVDCYLYDRDGKFLESDTSANDTCLFATPERLPGRYRVWIVNEGSELGVYSIVAKGRRQ